MYPSSGGVAPARIRLRLIRVLVAMPMPSAPAVIETDVEYIACGVIVTGTQLVAVVPSGRAQSVRASPSAAGIAPTTYMHASTSGVSGKQSVPEKLAEAISPDVP